MTLSDTPSPEELRSWWYEQLVEGTRRLALDYPHQRQWLEQLPVSIQHAGELGEGFGDFARFAPQLVDHGRLSADAADAIQKLDTLLATMSGPSNAALWSFDALRGDSRWAEVRRSATHILELLEMPTSG